MLNYFKINKLDKTVNIIHIDSYLKWFNYKLAGNKPRLIKYLEHVIHMCFFINAIKFYYCLRSDNSTRKLLVDISLYFGGFKGYNISIIILMMLLGSVMFRSLHTNATRSTLKWLDSLKLIGGFVAPGSISFVSNNINLEKTVYLAKISYIMFLIIYSGFCEYYKI